MQNAPVAKATGAFYYQIMDCAPGDLSLTSRASWWVQPEKSHKQARNGSVDRRNEHTSDKYIKLHSSAERQRAGELKG